MNNEPYRQNPSPQPVESPATVNPPVDTDSLSVPDFDSQMNTDITEPLSSEEPNTPSEPVSPMESSVPVASVAPAVTPDPTVESSVNQPDSPKKSPQKRFTKFIVAGIAAAVLLSGGSALAYNVWYQNPNKVLGDALGAALSADTVKADGSLNVESDEASITSDYMLNFDKTNSKVGLDADVKSLKVDESPEVAFNVSGVYENEKLYVRLSESSDLLALVFAESQLDRSTLSDIARMVDGQWLDLSEEPRSGDSNSQGGLSCTSKALSKINPEDFNKEVKQFYTDSQFIGVTEKLDSKSINGVDSLGYQLKIDENKYEKFTDKMKSSSVGKALSECEDEISDESSKSSEGQAKPKNSKINVWISRWSHELTRVELSNDKTRLTADLNFNGEVSVPAPKDHISMEQLVEKIMPALFDSYLRQMELSTLGESA